jgi:hypothetical protein
MTKAFGFLTNPKKHLELQETSRAPTIASASTSMFIEPSGMLDPAATLVAGRVATAAAAAGPFTTGHWASQGQSEFLGWAGCAAGNCAHPGCPRAGDVALDRGSVCKDGQPPHRTVYHSLRVVCCLSLMLIVTQRIREAFGQACSELNEEFIYDHDRANNFKTVRFPRPLPSSTCVLTYLPAQKCGAQCAEPTDPRGPGSSP